MTRFAIALLLAGTLVFAQTPAKDAKKPAPAPKAEAAKPAPKAETAAGLVGNKDSKTLHKSDCKIGAKMKAENKVVFASKDEALKAGYTPCKVCIKPE